MRLCYFIQNHLAPPQVARLVGTIRRSQPEAFVLVGHDEFAGHCRAEEVRRATGADVFATREPARRSYFSMLFPYVEAVEWLSRHAVPYDWIVHLSAQDYPVQPLRRLEERLATEGYDGYLHYWRAFDPVNPWGRKHQGLRRYAYQYFDAPSWLAPGLRGLRWLNGIQSLVHLHLVYGPRVGLRLRSPFGPGLVVYAGKAWSNLRRECAEFVASEVRAGGEVVQWFRRTSSPEEALLQTLLVNDGRFRLHDGDRRYVDFTGSRDGRPRTLTEQDLPVITGGEYDFARKFDREARVLDLLDERIG
jgi:hypothetical protein